MPRFNLKVAAVVIPAALLLAACGGTNTDTEGAASAPAASASEIRIDGSSTVAPLSAAAGDPHAVKVPLAGRLAGGLCAGRCGADRRP